MRFHRLVRAASILVPVLVFGSCSSDRVTTVEVASVRLSPEVTTLSVGESQRFGVDLRDSGGRSLPASIVEWTVEPASVLRVDASGLVEAVGMGTGTVRATARDLSGTATVVVGPGPTFQLSQPTVEIRGLVGSTISPEPTTLDVTNAGGGTLTGLDATVEYAPGSQGWLTPSLGSTTAPTTLQLSAATTGLPVGVYEAVVRLRSESPAAAEVEIPVALQVVSNQPTVGTMPGLVAFSGIAGGVSPPPQAVIVENIGGGTLDELTAAITYGDGEGWLEAVLAGTSAPTTLTLQANASALSPGTYRADVRVAAADAPASGADVEVSFEVGAQADVRVLLAGPETVVAGGRVQYDVRLRNDGPSAAEDFVVTHTLPSAVTVVELPADATLGEGFIRWDLGSFASGAQRAFQVEVDVAPSAIGRLTHELVAVSPTPDPEPGERQADFTSDVVRSADIEVALSGPDTAFVGGVTDLRVIVRNRGPSDAIAVSVTDTLPEGLTFVPTPGGGSVVGPVVSWPPVPTLAAGDSLVLRLRVSATGAAGSTWSTTAVARTAAPDPDAANDAATLSLASVARAGLAAVAGGPGTADNTEVVTLVAGVRNAGPGAAENVTVTQVLGDGLRLVSAEGATIERGVLQWPEIEQLAPGDSIAFEAQVAVDVQPPAKVSHAVAVSSATPDLLAADDTATATVTVPLIADLALRLEAPAVDTAGSPVPYRIVVLNEGPEQATAVQIVDSLPPGSVVLAASDGAVESLGAVTWPTVPTLAAGDSLVRTLVVAYDPAADGSSPVHRAHVAASSLDRDTLDDRAEATTLLIAAADVTVDVGGPSAAVSVDTVTWTVTVANLGPSLARDVLVVDTLSEGVTFVEASDLGVEAAGVVAWPMIDSLAPGEERALTVRAAIDPTALGPLVNRGAVTTTTPDPDATNDADAATTTLPREAELSVEMSGPAADTVGTLLTYTIRVRNAGPTRARNVVLVDTLPENVAFVSASGTVSVQDRVVVWDLASIRSGRSKARQLVVRIDEAATEPVVNRARTYSDNPDTEIDDNVATLETALISRSAAPPSDRPG